MPKMPKKAEPKVVAVSRYDRDDYPACRALPPADNGMEETYDEWLSYQEPVIAALIADGTTPEIVEVRSQDLGAWLRAKGLPNSPQNRARYLHDVVSARYVTKQ